MHHLPGIAVSHGVIVLCDVKMFSAERQADSGAFAALIAFCVLHQGKVRMPVPFAGHQLSMDRLVLTNIAQPNQAFPRTSDRNIAVSKRCACLGPTPRAAV